LVLRQNEQTLQPVEIDAFNASHIEEKLEVNYSDSSRFEVSTLYQGGKADAIRSSLSGASVSEMEENYLQYYAKSFEDIVQSETIIVQDDSSKNQLIIKESYAIPKLWEINSEGKEAFEVYAKAIYDLLPDPSEISKKCPMALTFPSTTYYTLTIVMPDLWAFPLNNLHIKNSSYQFDYEPSVSGRVITLKYTFKTLKDHVPANEMALYKANYKLIVDKLSFELYRGNSAPSPGRPFGGGLNWPMVWFTFGVMVAMSFLFKYLNSRNSDKTYNERFGSPIGSWLILLGISLGGACIVQVVDIFNNNYFDRSTWIDLGEAGGVGIQSVFVLYTPLFGLLMC
jgi:hypothetical protein